MIQDLATRLGVPVHFLLDYANVQSADLGRAWIAQRIKNNPSGLSLNDMPYVLKTILVAIVLRGCWFFDCAGESIEFSLRFDSSVRMRSSIARARRTTIGSATKNFRNRLSNWRLQSVHKHAHQSTITTVTRKK